MVFRKPLSSSGHLINRLFDATSQYEYVIVIQLFLFPYVHAVVVQKEQ
jgi:hypothetical protein